LTNRERHIVGNMKMITSAAFLTASGLLAAQAHAADATLIQQGRAAFEYHCAACHGTTIVSGNRHLPGTEALLVKYQGKEPGALEKRTDLEPALVKYYVRHGFSVMPFFRKTMVSDAELDAIAAYLARNYHPIGHNE
jgi:mono/diheme cytochrome c family protein